METDRNIKTEEQDEGLYSERITVLLRRRSEIDRILKERFTQNVVIMFTDINASTAFYEKYGDIAGKAMVQKHNDMLFPMISENGGTVVKTIGDAIMATFERAENAAWAAVCMQAALARYNASITSEKEFIHIRIGLNHGRVITQEDDIYGDAVNVAARVEAAAEPDEIVVSEFFLRALGSDTTLKFKSKGAIKFKGKEGSIEVFSIDWKEAELRGRLNKPQEVVSRYRILETIGIGGMATVFRGEDTKLGRTVAIKVLHPHLTIQPTVRERFHREAHIIANLKHENIIVVYDYSGPQSSESYIVTEFVEGGSLAQFLHSTGTLPPWLAAHVCVSVGRALAHAHRSGIIHRDVKPENIMIEKRGRVKLTDFGIASGKEFRRITMSDQMIGTPAYMAPEQISGGEIDGRTDVFALGSILYQCVTGKLPFEGEDFVQTASRITSGVYERLENLRPGLHPAILAACGRALHKDPAKRHSTAEQFVHELLPAASAPGQDADEEVAKFLASPLAAPEIAEEPVKMGLRTRAPALRIAAAALAALAIALAVFAAVKLAGSGGREQAVEPAPVAEASPPQQPMPEVPVTPLKQPSAAAVEQPSKSGVKEKAPDIRKAGQKNRHSPPRQAAAVEQPPQPQPPAQPQPPQQVLRPAVEDPGALVLHVFPWATVMVDGRSLGDTPYVSRVKLAPGQHTLQLFNPHCTPYSEQFTISTGKDFAKRVKLECGN